MIFAATDDRLHQQYRDAAYPASLQLVQDLRDAHVAAAVSGAGPAVLAFSQVDAVAEAAPPGWDVWPLGIAAHGAQADVSD